MPKRTPRPPATIAAARTRLTALGWSCEELHVPGQGPRKARGPGKRRGPLTATSSGYWLVLAHRGERKLAGKAREQLAAWLSLVEQAEKIGYHLDDIGGWVPPRIVREIIKTAEAIKGGCTPRTSCGVQVCKPPSASIGAATQSDLGVNPDCSS